MYVLFSSLDQEPLVSLEETDDCQRFWVVIDGLVESIAQQAFALADMGWLADRDTAWVKIAALRRLAGPRVRPDWPERFEHMLRYAESKGWLNAEKTHVKGHCEWQEEIVRRPG
jgi:hypothetical protein